MEGLVTEATKHIIEKGPEIDPLLDVFIIAQCPPASHYSIAEFDIAATYAKRMSVRIANKFRETANEIYEVDR